MTAAPKTSDRSAGRRLSGPSNERVDALVIGGGPAGCSAAISLALGGHRVALAEAKAYPHDKVCGEVLSPEAVTDLDALGALPAIRALHPVALRSASIITPTGTRWTGVFPAPGLGLSRRALDATLASRARSVGVTVLDGTMVTALSGDLGMGFCLRLRSDEGERDLAARVVVGAHGKRSTIDRRLNRAFLARHAGFVGLKMHFAGPPIGGVELHAFPGGYCGLSDVEGDRVNACLLVRQSLFQSAVSEAGTNIESFVRWMRTRAPRLDAWMARATPLSDRWLAIAQVSFASRPAVEADVLMAGDSAGLLAPLAGDGMAMALQSGRIVAAHLNAFLQGGPDAAALRAGYTREWAAAFRFRLRLGRLLQSILLRPRLLGPGLRALNALPPVGQWMVAQTRGAQFIHAGFG